METIQDRESFDLDAGRYAQVVRHHWVPAVLTFISVVALAAIAALLQEPSYRTSAQLLFRISRTPTITGLAEGSEELDPLTQNQNPLTTETQVISSQPLLEQVVENLDLLNEEGEPLSASALRNAMEISILPGADVVEVAYAGEDPETAAAIVNEVTRLYIERNESDSRAEVEQARELIDRQLPAAESFVRESESALRAFKEQNNVTNLDLQAGSLVNLTQTLDEQILATRANLEEATSQAQQLRENLDLSPEEAIVASDLSQAPGVQGALTRLQEVEQQLAVERAFYTESSPTVQNLQAQQQELRSLLGEEIGDMTPGSSQVPERFLQVGAQRQQLIANLLTAELQRQSLERRLDSLLASRSGYTAQSGELPRLEQRQAELNRQLEVARDNYQQLLQKQQDLQVAEEQARGNVSLLEAAEIPNNPSRTKQLLIIAMGIVAGAFLANVLVFLLDMRGASRQRQLSGVVK